MEVAPWNRKKPGTSRVTASENETFILKLHKFSMEKGWPEPSYKILPRHPKNERPTYGCQVEVSLFLLHYLIYLLLWFCHLSFFFLISPIFQNNKFSFPEGIVFIMEYSILYFCKWNAFTCLYFKNAEVQIFLAIS